MGVAVSLSEGEGTFDDSWATTGEQGRAESTMTTVSPYARFRLTERVSAWGLVGWGTGAMTLRFDDGSETVRRDLSMRLGAAGARGRAAGARQHGRHGPGAEGRCVLRDDGVGAGVGRDRHDGRREPAAAGAGGRTRFPLRRARRYGRRWNWACALTAATPRPGPGWSWAAASPTPMRRGFRSRRGYGCWRRTPTRTTGSGAPA